MSSKNSSLARALALAVSLAAPLLAHAVSGPYGSLQVGLDGDSGPLAEYMHQGDTYVAGERGQSYSLVLRNPSRHPVLAVVSVDGINVLDGSSASFAGGGYVIAAFGKVEITGWRKSLSEVARFNFAGISGTYAARTGRPGNIGVIGAALFRMKPPAPPPMQPWAESDSANLAPKSISSSRMGQSIGTGHGQREESQATTVEFERASNTPNAVLTLRYDTRRALQAKGVIPMRTMPSPFPHEPRYQGHFVPDPR